MLLVRVEQMTKTPLAEDNDVIKAVSPDRTATELRSGDPVCPWL
jgi:hypothetical protein